MKNKIIFITLFVSTFVFTAAAQDIKKTDARALKDELFQLLKPDYRYDKSNVSEIVVQNVLQGGEIGVPILSTEKYRLLFNTAGYPEDIKIKIYDKVMGSENRTLIYSNEEEIKSGKTIFMYKPNFDRFKTIYIDYIIPPSTDGSLLGTKGLIVFLMGYKNS